MSEKEALSRYRKTTNELNKQKEQAIKNIKQCWANRMSEAQQVYLQEAGRPIGQGELGVGD